MLTLHLPLNFAPCLARRSEVAGRSYIFLAADAFFKLFAALGTALLLGDVGGVRVSLRYADTDICATQEAQDEKYPVNGDGSSLRVNP